MHALDSVSWAGVGVEGKNEGQGRLNSEQEQQHPDQTLPFISSVYTMYTSDLLQLQWPSICAGKKNGWHDLALKIGV